MSIIIASVKISAAAMAVAVLLFSVATPQGSVPSDSADSVLDARLADLVKTWYFLYAIDTTGPEPLLSAMIYTIAECPELWDLGVIPNQTEPGKTFTASLPIRNLPKVSGLDCVEQVVPSPRVVYLSDRDGALPKTYHDYESAALKWTMRMTSTVDSVDWALRLVRRSDSAEFTLAATPLLPSDEITAQTSSDDFFVQARVPAGNYDAILHAVEPNTEDLVPMSELWPGLECTQVEIHNVSVIAGEVSVFSFDLTLGPGADSTGAYDWRNTCNIDWRRETGLSNPLFK